MVTVHRKNGFFVFNAGQGIEYTLCVAVMCLVPGTLGAGRFSLDHLIGFAPWSAAVNLGVVLILGLGGAAAQLAAFYRPGSAN
jgi:putative oxidoreductase